MSHFSAQRQMCIRDRSKEGEHFVGDILTAIMYEKNSKSYLKGMKRTSHDVHTKPTILVYIKMALTKASASKG